MILRSSLPSGLDLPNVKLRRSTRAACYLPNYLWHCLQLVILALAFAVDVAECKGVAHRGGGGSSGVRLRVQEGDEAGTLNVILVVILPVAQMIFVLVAISIVRICYVNYCRPHQKKLDQVVHKAQEHEQSILDDEACIGMPPSTHNATRR